MKKVLFFLLLLSQIGWTQQITQRHLPVRYPNGQVSTKANAADTLLGTTSETAIVSLTQGKLLPTKVTIIVTTSDADVSGTPADSVEVIYKTGLLNTVVPVDTNAVIREVAGLGTWLRVFVFNRNGGETTNSTQAANLPLGEQLNLTLNQDVAADSVKYVITALGVFEER